MTDPGLQYSVLLAIERTTSSAAQRRMTATAHLYSVRSAVERTTSIAATTYDGHRSAVLSFTRRRADDVNCLTATDDGSRFVVLVVLVSL